MVLKIILADTPAVYSERSGPIGRMVVPLRSQMGGIRHVVLNRYHTVCGVLGEETSIQPIEHAVACSQSGCQVTGSVLVLVVFGSFHQSTNA